MAEKKTGRTKQTPPLAQADSLMDETSRAAGSSAASSGSVEIPVPTREDIVECARLYGPASIKALVEVMQDGKEASRVAAANSLLDRGYGKVYRDWDVPASGEEAEHAPSVPDLSNKSPDELERLSSLVWEDDAPEEAGKESSKALH